MFDWGHYFLLFIVSLSATALLVPFVRKFAILHGIVDMPGPRRINKKPIPRLGGLAMFGGLICALIVEFIGEYFGAWSGLFYIGDFSFIQRAFGRMPTLVFDKQILGIIAAFAFIVVLGVLDDIFSLRPIVKFVGQLAACCIIAYTGTLLARFNLPFSNTIISFGFWAYPITVIYLVCFINIINLIDGLDGLAAGVTGIATLTLFIIMITLFREDAALMAAILFGMCLGFLIYNFNPASIFMGDCGSMLLGLMFGTVSLLGAARFASVTVMIVPVIIALVPIVDTFGAIVRRLRGHESVASADAGHIHHRLLGQGFSQRRAVLLMYAWTALLSIGALLIWEVGGFLKYCVFTFFFLVSGIVVFKLHLFVPIRQHLDVAEKTDGGSRVLSKKPEHTNTSSSDE